MAKARRAGDAVTGQQINWLLGDYDLSQMQGHKALQYDGVF
jgi:hypothetical protein